MPLCPQITITPVTVTSSNMTVTSVIAGGDPATTETVNTVSTNANTALSDAATALSQANAAYTLAGTSLQKSANTITNASNQLTAINGTGITVYAGSSATSGARVVLNSAGLAGYNSSNSATFAIDASTGSVSLTGALFTSGSILGGSLNINGNCVINSSGFLTATGATITGTITATSGTFTGQVNADSGRIGSAANGWSITSGSINAGTSYLYTPNGNSTYSLYTPDREVYAKDLTLLGTGATSINTVGGITASGNVVCGGATVNGSLYGSTSIYSSPAITGRTLLIAPSGSSYQIGTSSSSRTVKQDIAPAEFDPTPLLDLPLQQFRYIHDVEENGDNAQTQIGLIAEDLADAGLETLIDRDENGQPNYIYWSERMPQALLKLIQLQQQRINDLEARIVALENK